MDSFVTCRLRFASHYEGGDGAAAQDVSKEQLQSSLHAANGGTAPVWDESHRRDMSFLLRSVEGDAPVSVVCQVRPP